MTSDKPPVENYYGNINPDLLEKIPLSAQRILEIGCGQGRLGEAYKARQTKAHYFGVELMPEEAKEAQTVLDGVYCADIEQNTSLPKDFLKSEEKFDVLVFGDVLEHLRDPWKVLADLRHVVTPEGVCVACIPNVGHWSLVRQLLSGRWDYAESGLLDRTHVRFFTLETAIEMFQKAGWRVTDASPRNLRPEKTEQAMLCLKRVGLEAAANQMPSEISGGMKKRVGIARAIVMNPKYLFCDEPNSGLDPLTAVKIDLLIQEITVEYGITTIVISHDMNSVMRMGQYIMFLKDGKKMWEGNSTNMMSNTVPELQEFLSTKLI